jgi:hypothetical protein
MLSFARVSRVGYTAIHGQIDRYRQPEGWGR